ncbi:MAG: SDR family NAD(P)-dependent oxidoreductase [Deltaproteobacteria bacterium]|nr:SDR family NAD(P)-dependent oxidoreductase [Deltaproteobacteria bacterium]
MQLAGSSALVTGAASGLGAATARRLAADGAKVVVVDRDEARGAALAAEIGGAFAKADVTDAAQLEAAIAEAGKLAPLRVAVSCAGVGWASRTLDKTGTPHKLDLFQTVIGINLVGTFNVLRLAAAAIAKSEPLAHGARGVIVNTASVAAYDGQIGQIAYAASKAGVVGMTLPAARDLAPAGIRVVTIAPGIFDTPMLGTLPEDKRAALAADVVAPRRLGDPAEYAALVAAVVGNDYLNGETIRLDGALRMPPK